MVYVPVKNSCSSPGFINNVTFSVVESYPIIKYECSSLYSSVLY